MKAQVNEVELYYDLQGEGEPIVFIHGLLDDSSVWNAQIELFTANYRVITYDLRGHGRSDKPKGNYSIQTLADDLYALMNELNLEKAMIVGHSEGGMVAILFTLDHPDKVSKLVLVSSGAKASLLQGLFSRLKSILPYGTFVKMVTGTKYRKPSEQVTERAMEIAMNVPKHVMNEYWNALTGNYDVKRSLYRIETPTLIIAGEKDTLIPLSRSKLLIKGIEGSELRTIPECGHMVMIEKPGELNEILQEFIDRNMDSN